MSHNHETPENGPKSITPVRVYKRTPKLHTLAVPESLIHTPRENGQLEEPFELLPTVSDSRVAPDLPPPSTSSPLLSTPPSMTLSTPVPTLPKTQLRTPKSTPEQNVRKYFLLILC